MRKLVALLAGAVVLAVGVFLLWPGGGSGGITLYSGLDYGPAVARAFTARTGIPVQVIRLPTGGLLARITAEGHHPAWTVAWFDGATAAVALDRAGLLAHGLPAPATLVPAATIPGTAALRGADAAYVPTGFTLAGVFVMRRDAPFPAPADWADLLDPRYRGRIGMNDPAISGPTYPTLAGMLRGAGGWPAGQGYVTALRGNGLHVFAKNDATLAALRAGAIGIAVVQSSAAIAAATADPRLRVVFPRPAYVLPNVIVAAHGLTGPARAAAIRFVAFVNTVSAQRLRMAKGGSDGLYWPVTRAPAPPAALPPLAGLDLAWLDPVRWGARENAILAWFAHPPAVAAAAAK